jgi:hypothetical protein
MSLLTSLISSGVKNDIRATGNTWTISGTDNDLNVLSVSYPSLYSPNCWYDNGRTYMPIRQSHTTSNGRIGILQYYNGEVTQQFMSSDPGSLDYHDNPVIITDGAGKIFIFHEQHITDRSEVWVNSAPYDITTFSLQGISALIGDYPKLFRINPTSYFIIGRRILYTLNVTSFDGTNFGTPFQLSQADAETSNYRHYPFGYVNGFTDKNGWFNLRVAKRIYVTEQFYTKYYHMKCSGDDINTWYNIDETFSKDVVANGELTETELDANFKYADNTVSGSGGGALGFIDDSDKMYHLLIIDGELRLYKYNNGFSYSTLAESSKTSLLFSMGNNKYSIGRSDGIINSYRTDFDTTFTLYQQLGDIANGVNQITMPANFNEIPKNGKFAIFAGTLKNDDRDVVNSTENNDIIVIEMIKK